MGQLDVSREYVYDTLDRLVTARVKDTQNWSNPSQKTSWYAYDDLGNRQTAQERDVSQGNYAHDLANRLTSYNGRMQVYSASGNVITAFSVSGASSYKYKYDHLNQLTAVWNAADTTRKAAYTYDALQRRVEFANDVNASTIRYYYDGANELMEFNTSDVRQRYYVHGLSYIDERIMMMKGIGNSSDRPFYYIQDRLYNVCAMIDRAGAIVERYAYDPYGLPLIRESAGRGDCDSDTDLDSTDSTRVNAVQAGTKWDARADMDDDGDVDLTDISLWTTKSAAWGPPHGLGAPTVAQAFSDIGNPYMFQGVPHMALDTASNATTVVLPLNQHRLRFNDCVTGRWLTRDPIGYADSLSLYQFLLSNPASWLDPSGLLSCDKDELDKLLERGVRLPPRFPEWCKKVNNATGVALDTAELCCEISKIAADFGAEAAKELAGDAVFAMCMAGTPIPGDELAALSKLLDKANALRKRIASSKRHEHHTKKITSILKRLKDRIRTLKGGPTLDAAKQGKHVTGHKGFKPGRSRLTHKDPQDLLDRFAGKGQRIVDSKGNVTNKERVDFKETIGDYVDEKGISIPTTKGVIHYDAKGKAHIVPANP